MHTQAFGTFCQTDPRGGTCLEEITKNMRSPTEKPQNLHFKTLMVALQFSWYTMTAGYAPCWLVLAEPFFMWQMETDNKTPFFFFQSDSDRRLKKSPKNQKRDYAINYRQIFHSNITSLILWRHTVNVRLFCSIRSKLLLFISFFWTSVSASLICLQKKKKISALCRQHAVSPLSLCRDWKEIRGCLLAMRCEIQAFILIRLLICYSQVRSLSRKTP